jgi:hypothetical protein
VESDLFRAIIFEFANLSILKYAAPWSDIRNEEIEEKMARATANLWCEILAPATPAEIAVAIRSWLRADKAGHWPKPGAVREHLPQRAPLAEIEGPDNRPEEYRLIDEACGYDSIREALWWGGMRNAQDRWPVFNEADPEHRAAVKRLLDLGHETQESGAVFTYRMFLACRRLLAVRLMLGELAEQSSVPVPGTSYGNIMVCAAERFDLFGEEVPLDELRAYLVQRIADDPIFLARYEERRVENEKRLAEKLHPGARPRSPVPQFMLDRVKRSETPAT